MYDTTNIKGDLKTPFSTLQKSLRLGGQFVKESITHLILTQSCQGVMDVTEYV
jgi:hypothetical protein